MTRTKWLERLVKIDRVLLKYATKDDNLRYILASMTDSDLKRFVKSWETIAYIYETYGKEKKNGIHET